MRKRAPRQFLQQRGTRFPGDIPDGADVAFNALPRGSVALRHIWVEVLSNQQQAFGLAYSQIHGIRDMEKANVVGRYAEAI